MQHSINRRNFLSKSCILGIGASVLPAGSALAQSGKKIRHACIGVGGMGYADFFSISSHPNVEIVAICDIDPARAEQTQKKVPKAKFYQDWRELLEKEELDSVNVSTPDHMHAPITMTALSKGCHVYCQKPLTHDIYEARMIGAKAAKSKLITQMGTQVSSSMGNRMAVKYIQNKTIGKIREVFLWSNKPAGKYRPVGPRPKTTDPVPKNLDWDGWIGTAPERPYVKGVYHPSWWRGWQDFGCGWLGDMGCHIMDTPFSALGLSMPISVKAEVEPEWKNNPERRAETFPLWQILEYIYPGTDLTTEDTIKLTWSDGGKYPPDKYRKHIEGKDWPAQGSLMIGEKGAMLLSHGSGPRLFPREQFRKVARPKLAAQNHYHQFIDAILGKNGGKTQTPFPYAARATEMVLMGTIALRFPDQELKWDAAAMRFTNVADANQYVRRTYRKGWGVEGL